FTVLVRVTLVPGVTIGSSSRALSKIVMVSAELYSPVSVHVSPAATFAAVHWKSAAISGERASVSDATIIRVLVMRILFSRMSLSLWTIRCAVAVGIQDRIAIAVVIDCDAGLQCQRAAVRRAIQFAVVAEDDVCSRREKNAAD